MFKKKKTNEKYTSIHFSNLKLTLISDFPWLLFFIRNSRTFHLNGNSGCSSTGQVESVNYLLSRCAGIEVDARNNLGFTPLMKAAIQGRTKCAKLLLFAGLFYD